MKVYFITRFSICDPHFRGFRLSTDYKPQEYERRLYSEERMKHKFQIFELNTFPSVVNQTNREWHWLIYTSDRLPEKHMARLKSLVGTYENIEILQVRDFPEFFERDRAYEYIAPF